MHTIFIDVVCKMHTIAIMGDERRETKVPLSVRIPETLDEQLNDVAGKISLSRTDTVTQALIKGLPALLEALGAPEQMITEVSEQSA